MNLTLDKAYSLFKEELESKNLSPATILAYTTDIKQLISFLKKERVNTAGEVKTANLLAYQKHLTKKGYLPVSWARKLNAFRKFFRFFQKKELLERNPVSSLSSPKVKKSPPRILSKMEYRALRDTTRSNPRTAALIEIFLQTGLKVNEVANLSLDDIKKESLIINKKGFSEERKIPLTPSVKKAIKEYLKVRPKSQSKKFFVTKNDTPLLIRNMSTILMRCFREAEIKNASLNSLRHTWIYHQLNSGLPLQLVSQLAGHKRVSTTGEYLNLIDKKISRATTKLKEL